MAHSEDSKSAVRTVTPDRGVHERMAAILAENEALRCENAALKSVKDALRESEERYRRLFEDDLTGDVVVAPDGRILSCNPAFARIFGFASREEAPGTDIRDLFEDPGDLDRVVATLRMEGKIENVGRRRRRRDGTRIHVVENVVGRFGPGGELLEIQGYIYDDSERKRAEEALRENMERYRQALDNPLTGYAYCEIVVDAAGKPADYIYLEVNRAFELFTGLRREKVVNRRVTEVLPPDEAAGIIAIYGNVALTGASTAFQYPVPTLAKWFEVTAFSHQRGRVTTFFTDITERKRAEEALRESEERYRRLFEDDLTGDFLTAADGRIIACNPAFVRMFGFDSVDDALDTDIRDLYEDPRDRDMLLARLQRDGKVENEGRVRKRRDGTRIHVIENVVGCFSADGELLETQGYAYDDSERKRAEDALRESMEWYRQALDNPLVAYVFCEIIADDTGKPVDVVYLKINKAFEQFTGLVREDVLNRRATEIFAPEDISDLIAIYGNVALTGESTTFQYPLPSLSRWYEVTAFSSQQGHVTAFFTDITGRKLAEEALQESEERFRAVLENSLDAAYRRNLQADRYDYMSPAIEEILGFTPEEMSAMNLEEIIGRIHPDDRPAVEAELDAAVASGRCLLVYRFLAKNGEYRWLEDHLMVIRDPGGRPLYRGGIVRDVTGRKEAEAELVRVHREANLYLDILTHDIGNTENVSNLYADLLVDSVEGEAAGYAANLKGSITKSIAILGIVSKIRRIHAGPPTLRPTDLDAVIRTEIDHFPAVPISYEGASCKVVADDLLCEVFTNLIGNAVKHGGPGVAVTVRVEEQNGEVLVTVADTGRGVPDNQKEEIFHRYERKQRGVGEGLGLYLVQILIDRYGGRIWVEDRVPGHPEEGAAFSFLLRETDAVHPSGR